jgi:hypothetical protein
MKHKIIANDEEHLKKLVEQEIEINGNNCDLNHIDVSNITSLHQLFFILILMETYHNGMFPMLDI